MTEPMNEEHLACLESAFIDNPLVQELCREMRQLLEVLRSTIPLPSGRKWVRVASTEEDAIAHLEAQVEELKASTNMNFVSKCRSLEAEAAAMRAALEDILASDDDRHTYLSLGGELQRKVQAALSGDAGRELLERHEALVRWARTSRPVIVPGFQQADWCTDSAPPQWLTENKTNEND